MNVSYLFTAHCVGTSNQNENENETDIKQEKVEITPDLSINEQNEYENDNGEHFEEPTNDENFEEDFNFDELKTEFDEEKSYFENYEQNTDFIDNKCSKCDKKFDHLMDLAVHFNKKHERINKRPHCPICPKDFR